jgi:uncharacterized protein (DUF4415 family)
MKKQSGTNWKAVDALNEADIDYSENPKLGPEFFARAVRWPGNKQLVSLRLDPDVLLFFKKQGKGYQTMINALLRKVYGGTTVGAGIQREEEPQGHSQKDKIKEKERMRSYC